MYGLIQIRARAMADVGRFGFFKKPDQASGVMGLFLTDGVMGEKLKQISMPSSAHEWTYLACARYWEQMEEVAGACLGTRWLGRCLGWTSW